MKKKYIDCSGYDWAIAFENYYIVEKDYYAITIFHEVAGDIPVDYESDYILFKKDSTVLTHVTDDYCLSAVKHGRQTIEWYFDMISHKSLDCKPYFLDLYLDVVVDPGGKVLTLDEDELIEAYQMGIINKEHLQKAYYQERYVRQDIVSSRDYMYKQLDEKHDDCYKELLTFRKFVEKNGPFDVPIYNRKNTLRFQLGGDEALLDKAFYRAHKLLHEAIDDDLYIIINSHHDKHGILDFIQAKSCYKRKHIENSKNGYIYQYIYKINKDLLDLDNIIRSVINKDFLIEPYTEDEIFFFCKNRVISIYDDCGLDVYGDHIFLQELKHEYSQWLID